MDGPLRSRRDPHAEGRGGGGMARPNHKRARTDATLTLKQQIISLKRETVVAQLGAILDEVGRNGPEGEQVLISTVLSCVQVFALETSTFALLVGSLACRANSQGELAPVLAMRILGEAIRRVQTGRARADRLLIRFLVASFKSCGLSLAPLLSNLLDPLLDQAVSNVNAGECTKQGEFLLLTVLSAVPWLACSQAASRSDAEEDAHCQEWLRAAARRMETVKRARTLVAQYAALPRAQQDRLDPDCDRIALGLAMLVGGGGDGDDAGSKMDVDFDYLLIARANSLPAFNELKEHHDQLVNDLVLQELAQMPARIAQAAGASLTSEHLSHLPLFKDGLQPVDHAASALEVQRKPSPVERFLVREQVLDVLGAYFPQTSEAADALLAVNSPYQAVEACLSQMLAMPTPEHSALFYSEVLIRMCLKAPDTVPAAIEDALDQVLELEPDHLDPDVLDRLALWFANHVLTFDLDFPWIKWRNVLQLAESRSVRALVETALQRIALVLAVTREALDEVEMPKELADRLLGLVRNTSNILPNDMADSTLGQEVMAMLKTKPGAAELYDFVLARTAASEEMEEEWTNTMRIRLLLHSALAHGSASLTHCKLAIECVAPVLIRLANDAAAAAGEIGRNNVMETVFQSVLDYYEASAGRMQHWAVFGIGCLLDAGVGSNALVLAWLAKLQDNASVLTSYFKRRAMEDVLARTENKSEAVQFVTSGGDLDDATDLWLSRRGM